MIFEPTAHHCVAQHLFLGCPGCATGHTSSELCRQGLFFKRLFVFELRARFLCAPPVNNRDTATKDFSGSLSLSQHKESFVACREGGWEDTQE